MGKAQSKSSKPDKSGCFRFGKSGAPKFERLNHEISLATLGLDNAGKTSIVLALSNELHTTEEIMPTVGFDSKKVSLFGQPVTLFDLGGESKIRGIWKNYLAEVHGVVYVVDAADTERVEESAREFHNLAKNAYIHGKPLLILANKSDKAEALSEYELTELMNLEEIVNVNKIPTKVQASTTVTKDHKTLKDGMKWLFMSIASDWESLHSRVETDAKELKEKKRLERKEKLDRIRREKEEREAAEDAAAKDGSSPAKGDSDDDDVVDGADPFQSLNDHLNSKKRSEASGKQKSAVTADKSKPTDKASAGDGHTSAPPVLESGIPNSNGQVIAKKPDRVPSPLPGHFGEGLNAFPSRLPPLSSSSPLKPLDLLSEETATKKKKKRKRKARISPTQDNNGLMPVEEEDIVQS